MAGSTFAASSTFNMDMVKANEDEPTNQNSNSRPGKLFFYFYILTEISQQVQILTLMFKFLKLM